jgi:hypothetical protein
MDLKVGDRIVFRTRSGQGNEHIPKAGIEAIITNVNENLQINVNDQELTAGKGESLSIINGFYIYNSGNRHTKDRTHIRLKMVHDRYYCVHKKIREDREGKEMKKSVILSMDRAHEYRKAYKGDHS